MNSAMELKDLSSNELVTVMNEVMAEVKSRLDEGTVTKYVEREIPSTVETVEHEGKVLRKVNRKANDGDYVRFHNQKNRNSLKDDVIYGPVKSYPNRALVVKSYNVYQMEHNRTTETVEVFVVEDFIDEIPFQDIPIIKYHNQQRAELIQRAREFVEGHLNGRRNEYAFHVNSEKNAVTCLIKGYWSGKVLAKGIAKCMPGDVFNESIGKAIALARALKIRIPREFLEAVQPDEIVVGHKIASRRTGGTYYEYDSVTEVDGDKVWGIDSGRKFIAFTYKNSRERYGGEAVSPYIIDDTNAEYEVESVGEKQ